MSDEHSLSKEELLTRLQSGWNDFQAYLKTLTDKQMTTPVDDVGWTVKDHLVHLALWEDGIAALLKGHNRWERMNVDQETWNSGDFEKINSAIQSRFKDRSLADVLKMLQDAHQRLVEAVRQLSDEDLRRPYHSFDQTSTSENPVIEPIIGNTYDHYEEHRPWIDAIAARAR